MNSPQLLLNSRKTEQGLNVKKLSTELIEKKLNAYFSDFIPFMQTVHFAYAVDVTRQQICYQYNFSEYLGYDTVEVNLGLLNDIMHPDEQKKLTAIYRRLYEFPRQYRIEPIKYGIVLGHQLRKADGQYVRVLRSLHPFLLDEHHRLLVYYCLCMDVSSHYFNTGITLDVILPSKATLSKTEALKYFYDIMTDETVYFTPRQIEVIKIWSETDSAKVAAERLSMKVRTLETHLKNIRKKLGARRTLDVVLYAKDHGLI